MLDPVDAVDLFAGPGGWEVAGARFGLRARGYELDETACATRAAAGLETVRADVAALVPQEHRARGLIGSPPCIGFSAGGSGLGRLDVPALCDRIRECRTEADVDRAIAELRPLMADPRSTLVLEPLRWALANDPEWVALEQVRAVLPVWEAIGDVLRARGYSVATGVLSAEEFGVPQTRERAVLVASRARRVRLPAPTHSGYYPHDPGQLDLGVPGWISMADAIGWGLTDRPAYTCTSGGARGSHSGHEWGSSAVRRRLLEAARSGDWRRWVPAPHRGDRDNDLIRVTGQEAGVLQTFPVSYPWQGTLGKLFQQAGNAVPPRLGQAVLGAVL